MSTLTAIFIATSTQFNLPPGLLASLCFVESGHDIQAIHYNDGNGNSIGICQIKYKTSQWLGFKGTEQELMNPSTNIYYAAAYLSYQRHRYQGSIHKAVIAYNYGHAGHLTSTEYQVKVYKVWQGD